MSAGPVHVVRLRLESQAPSFGCRAVQYPAVVHPDGAVIPFAIASAPHRLPELEVHFQPLPDNDDAARMLGLLVAGSTLRLQPPAGNVFVDGTEQALFFVCGGSGIAQAWSMLEHLSHQRTRPRVGLQWCVDQPSMLYLSKRLTQLDFIEPVIFVDDRRDEDNAGLAWLRNHTDDIRDGKIVLCGGPAFVWAAVDALQSGGNSRLQLASDVFDYAPR